MQNYLRAQEHISRGPTFLDAMSRLFRVCNHFRYDDMLITLGIMFEKLSHVQQYKISSLIPLYEY